MDADASLYDKLVAQCRSNDVDVKVEALTKLQALFERHSALEVSDPEGLINILKASLRASNLHLTNATLSALPTVLPVLITRPVNPLQSSGPPRPSSSTSSSSPSNLIDQSMLRLALASFLQPGGVIDRLGEKERAQTKARDTLVLLGGYAFRFGAVSAVSSKSGKTAETPLAMFERFLKEGGLASKVWKVREQSIMTLVHIRRIHHLFPIRPYLSLLVECLEDTDPHVRDCARQSVIELFSGPGVTDAARADLKRELTKKGVRKTIVDSVLSKLLGGTSSGSNPQSHEGSENGEASSGKQEYVPPSLALQGKRPRLASQTNAGIPRTVSQSSTKEIPRPLSRANMVSPPPSQPQTPAVESVEIRPVYIASKGDLENEFASMAKPFEGKETEHNWAARDQAIQRVRGMLKGDVHVRYSETFLAALKDGFIQWSTKTLASLRTTVAANTCLLYSELAIALGPLLDPHCELLLTNLLKMGALTKKITAQQSQNSVTTILTHTSPQPRLIVPLLWQTLQDKTVQSRTFAIAHLKVYLEMHGHRSKNALEASGSVEILEKCLKRALSDASPAVREAARVLFWVFEAIWKDRGQMILQSLDAVARKQLEKACPDPAVQASLTPATPQVSKKSSVAAAIAASRAKAKAIATAPPTLRHQATSASYAALPRRSGSPSTSPRSTTARPASPLRMSTSPPSQRRSTSTTLARSTSGPSIATSHIRTPSGSSDNAERSVSPSFSDGARRRLLSSPLVNTTSTLDKGSSAMLPPPPLSRLSPGVRQTIGAAERPRQSISQDLAQYDEELLLAQTVPIPDNTDSDDEASSVLNSSPPFERHAAQTPFFKSRKSLTLSPASDNERTGSVSNALSSGSMFDMSNIQQPVVEDALRARAEQAESAAERLLELVEPDDDSFPRHPTIPPLLLKTANAPAHMPHKEKLRPAPLPVLRHQSVPATPNSRASAVLRQAALFVDSPARNGSRPSLLDVLQSQRQESGWWLKRRILLSEAASIKSDLPSAHAEDLNHLISEVDHGRAGITTLKQLTIICKDNATIDPSSPSMSSSSHPSSPSPSKPLDLMPTLPSSISSIWERDKTFDRLFSAVLNYLTPTKNQEELAYALILLFEMIENQASFLEGKEGDLFLSILRVRYCNMLEVLEGTNAIRDTLTSKIDPVYGLTTLHASLKSFQSEEPSNPGSEDIKASSYAFGLIALGKFILRLPAEIAEEELPRLKVTLINALNDKSSLIVRESAAASIIAAQLVLQDETHLFALLEGLADDKKNLLTYLFDKHSVRGAAIHSEQAGIKKLEKEIKRLDTRIGTPLHR